MVGEDDQIDDAEAQKTQNTNNNTVWTSVVLLPHFPKGTLSWSYFCSVSQRQGVMAWDPVLFI